MVLERGEWFIQVYYYREMQGGLFGFTMREREVVYPSTTWGGRFIHVWYRQRQKVYSGILLIPTREREVVVPSILLEEGDGDLYIKFYDWRKGINLSR